jgi:hypothetical protein
MRILIIPSFNSNSNKNKQLESLLNILKSDTKNDIGLLEAGNSTKVIMGEANLVSFRIECKNNEEIEIPRLTPSQLNSIYNFFSEFNPEIIHSYDEGIVSLIAQFWSIRNKTPFLLSMGKMQSERSLPLKLFLKMLSGLGFNERFINNFYHNSTAIILNNESDRDFIKKINFEGKTYENVLIEDVPSIYSDLLDRQKEYVGSKAFSNLIRIVPTTKLKNSVTSILPQGSKSQDQKSLGIRNVFWVIAAIIGSLITYFTLRGKNKK